MSAERKRLYELYEAVIGLEIHVELKTAAKMFCRCRTDFGLPMNTACCPVCMGYPGTLPVPNGEAVRKTVAAGLALGCNIERASRFSRKNYFYPDLPKAYQISQDEMPLCTHGGIEITGDDGIPKRIGIERIHLEEDAGKLIHTESGTLVDYNRCGIPLAEIVTEPDLRSAEETSRFVKKLRNILVYSEISDCRMNEGSLRCDVNISVRKKGDVSLGVRAEIKNLNSFRFIEEAIEYEFLRQAELLDGGGLVALETRRYDENIGKTCSMRPKESHSDYRFFEEPDIGDIILTEDEIERIKASLPELPDSRERRYLELGISSDDAAIIIGERRYSDYFDSAAHYVPKEYISGLGKFFSQMIKSIFSEDGKSASLSAKHLAMIHEMLADGKISSSSAKKLISLCAESGDAPEDVALREDMYMITDREKILRVVKDAIERSPKAAADFKSGKTSAAKSVVGLVMSISGGKVDPRIASELTMQILGE